MIQPPTCVRYLERYGERSGPDFHLTAAGVDELMGPCIVDRPAGTKSWLLMQFHSPVRIKTGAGVTDWFPENAVMLWNETDGHYYGNPDREWSHSWIHCVGDVVKRIAAKSGLPLRTPFLFPQKERFNSLVAQMHWEATSWKSPDETILLKLLEIVFLELSRSFKGAEASPLPQRLIDVKRHMERNLGSKILLAQLAAVAKLSIPQFCAEFKRHFGKSPIDALITLRLERGRQLLSNKNMTVKEVSRSVGYEDPFQFSKLFKKRFGAGPRETRKLLLREL